MGELREILRANRISGTLVVDKDKLVGIVSIEDFIKCLANGEIDTFIENKMTKKVETLYADEPLIHAVNKFNKHGFGRFPVIERDNGKLVGIITKSDLKKSLDRLGIHPLILRRVAIATYEAEMNIVIFTSGGRITAYVKPDEIRVEAIDTGPGITDVKQAMQPGFSPASPKAQEGGFGAGMGLPNIKKCADNMYINSKAGKGTKLAAIIYTGR